MEIEYQIKLTDITKIFIKHFDKGVNQLKNNKLIFILINDCNKVQ